MSGRDDNDGIIKTEVKFREPKVPRTIPSSSGSKTLNEQLDYIAPLWSIVPPLTTNWSLEVIKGGVTIGNFDAIAARKAYLIVGRHTTCDINLEHASISRFHSILQFSQNENPETTTSKNNFGGVFFLYDLSTHGTFLNKKQVKPREHVLLNDGDHIRFGASSRIHVVHGPPIPPKQQQLDNHNDDEIIDQEEKIEELLLPLKKESLLEKSSSKCFQNQTVVSSIQDPRRVLKDWLDAHGIEMEIEVTHPTFSGDEFLARVRVPIDRREDFVSVGEQQIFGEGRHIRQRTAERLSIIDVLEKMKELGMLDDEVAVARNEKKRLFALFDSMSDDNINCLQSNDVESSSSFMLTKKVPKRTETYESLIQKKISLESHLLELENNKKNLEITVKDCVIEEDSLDNYMIELQENEKTRERKQIEKKIKIIEEDLLNVKNMIKLVEPSSLLIKSPKIMENLKIDKTDNLIKKYNEKTPSKEIEILSEENNIKIDEIDEINEEMDDINWVPPVNQNGSGRTSLNDKFGY